MTQFNEELVEKVARAMCLGRNPDAIVPNPRPSGQVVGLEGNTYLWQKYIPLTKAALSLIAPNYEKQLAELKERAEWKDISTAPRYDIVFVCRRKIRPHITFEAMITTDQDGWENPVYDVLVNVTNEDDILDGCWSEYEWNNLPKPPTQGEV